MGETLLFDLTWVLASAIVAVAATLQAITGFGFAMISVPLLLLVLDARAAVILSMLLGFLSQAMICRQCYRDRVPLVTRNLLWGTVAGLPLGTVCLLGLQTGGLKLLANAVVLLFSLALLARERLVKAGDGRVRDYPPEAYSLRREQWLQRGVGLLAGFLNGSVNMGGAPIVIFLNQRGLAKETFRATVSAYSILTYFLIFAILIGYGAISGPAILLALTLTPAVCLGSQVGARLFPLVSPRHFRQGVPLLVLVTAGYGLLAAFF